MFDADQRYYSFCIRQTPFPVTEMGGGRQDIDSLRDTASIPPAEARVPKVMIPFADAGIVGRLVYHCHAVDHEDKGTMGTVLVVA